MNYCILYMWWASIVFKLNFVHSRVTSRNILMTQRNVPNLFILSKTVYVCTDIYFIRHKKSKGTFIKTSIFIVIGKLSRKTYLMQHESHSSKAKVGLKLIGIVNWKKVKYMVIIQLTRALYFTIFYVMFSLQFMNIKRTFKYIQITVIHH